MRDRIAIHAEGTMDDLIDTAPRASTHAWCLVCCSIRPTSDRPLHEASRRNRPGFEGATLHCEGCDSALLTIYVAEAVPAWERPRRPLPRREGAPAERLCRE